MQNNVINLNGYRCNPRPNDLLRIKDFEKKYGLKYEYLYKWSVQKKQITVYSMGGIALSESEVLGFEERKAKKYGGNQ